MPRNIFIREVLTTKIEPNLCPVCSKEDKLEKDLLREKSSDGKTIFCSRCQALVIITTHHLKRVDLEARKDEMVFLKEPYYVRELGY